MAVNRFPPTPGLADAAARLGRAYDAADKRDAAARARTHMEAAAPDMLAALKECLPLFDMVTALDDHGSNALGQAENLIRAAIAKAEGAA